MLDLVVTRLEQSTALRRGDGTERPQTSFQHLERGEHDAVFAVLDTRVHQVFNEADLGPQVPDPEEQNIPAESNQTK